ncbi:MAG: TRAM domain-containing protein [Spirochaetes bacterium]|nr:TRAM domain-containing protein [Spirochaetota bacterium]
MRVLDIIFILVMGGISAIMGYSTGHTSMIIYYAIGGLVTGGLFKFLTFQLAKLNGQRIFFSVIGVLFGFILGDLIFKLLSPILTFPAGSEHYFRILFILISSYSLGVILYYKSFEIRLPGSSFDAKVRVPLKDEEKVENYKILDTSVIIDGRIADICETGFLEGILIIPRFVLNELQQIADSSDSLKRQRGRRGLDILNKIKKGIKTLVQIVDDDFPSIREVDEKLIELAKKFVAGIITNDYNLNKVAQIHGVKVLNINELANALKPIVLPGEELTVQIIREGKDPSQGIGYLEDGTMVVVEEGLQYMGKKVDVIVTSVLQTTAGRMIFAK